MAQLIGADVIRPGLGWLMATSSPLRIANEMGRVRDPAGLPGCGTFREGRGGRGVHRRSRDEKVALIMAAKGGMVADITVGDCLELVRTSREVFPGPSRSTRHSPFFYQLLHAAGVFPADAPPTVRMFSSLFTGQLTVEQMVDRYDLACRPVRDLLVDYLRERQPAHRLQHPDELGDRAGAVVLERPGGPPSRASARCACRPTSPPPGSSGSASRPPGHRRPGGAPGPRRSAKAPPTS